MTAHHDFLVKDEDTPKPRFDLLIPGRLPYEQQMLTRWAALMARGITGHGERGWENSQTPEDLARYRQKAFRHFMQWFNSVNDGEDHAAAVLFNITAAEYTFWRWLQAHQPADA